MKGTCKRHQLAKSDHDCSGDRTSQRILGSLVRLTCLLLLCLSPVTAEALSPISDEGTLCRGSYVFVGRVLAATTRDCRDVYKDKIEGQQIRDCSPRHTLHFKVYVVQLLSSANPSSQPGRQLHSGEVIEVLAIVGHEEDGSRRAEDVVQSSNELAARYVPKEFIFSIQMSDFELHSQAGPWVNFWPMRQEEWAVSTLQRRIEGCAPPL